MMLWNKERSVLFEQIRSLNESYMVERRMVWKKTSVELAFDYIMKHHLCYQTQTLLVERLKR